MGHMARGRPIETPRFTAAEVTEWRRLMRVCGWSQKDLATKLGIAYSTVKKFLTKDAYGELE